MAIKSCVPAAICVGWLTILTCATQITVADEESNTSTGDGQTFTVVRTWKGPEGVSQETSDILVSRRGIRPPNIAMLRFVVLQDKTFLLSVSCGTSQRLVESSIVGGEQRGRFTKPFDCNGAAVLSDDSKMLAIADSRGIVVLDAFSGVVKMELPLKGTQGFDRGASCLSFAHDGKILAAGGAGGKNSEASVLLIETSTGDVLGGFASEGGANSYLESLVWSPSGKFLCASSPPGRLLIWDRRLHKVVFEEIGMRGSVCFLGQDDRILFEDHRRLVAMNTQEGREIYRSSSAQRAIKNIIMSADSKSIVVNCGEFVCMLNKMTFEEEGRLRFGNEHGECTCVTTLGDLVACGFADGALTVLKRSLSK